MCVLVGESSSGKSTVLAAVWTLLEAAAPMPTVADVSHGYTRIHVEADAGGRTLFLDARPPGTLNLNREGAPPALFFPAHLRPTSLARADRPPGEARRVGRQERQTEDGGLSLVRAIAALADARIRGHVILIEEPELYLSPPSQRHLHTQLHRLAARGRNQVLYSTHSPVFLGVDRLEQLVLVRHDHRTGTTLLQPDALPRDQALRLAAELDAERAEIFLSRAVMLVEGRTEKLAFPFVFRALGYDADREAIAIVDCAGKGNIPLFAEVCNACQIPYVVVHDKDAPRGQPPTRRRAHLERGDRAHRRQAPHDRARAGLRRRRGRAGAAREAGRGVQALRERRTATYRAAQAGGRARRRERAPRAAYDARAPKRPPRGSP